MRINVGLSAVIVAADDVSPWVLTAGAGDSPALPFGPFSPTTHRTFELGLREWVEAQTGFDLGYVEQLYTFGDLGRDLPLADIGGEADNTRTVSVGYLGLAAERTPIARADAIWRDWYGFFPWEDHRSGRPGLIDRVIAPALSAWAHRASGPLRELRLERARVAFGLEGGPWIEERALERYELMYEAGLAPEAVRDAARTGAIVTVEPPEGLGTSMVSDHRRILATAIGRLRGKIKYRPIVFELIGETFTLSRLQKLVEALLGQPLHKQNFRRALDKSGLVKGTGQFETATGGRPAELFRVRRERLSRGAPLGVQTPTLKG